MADGEIISRIKEAEMKAEALIAHAEQEAEGIRTAAVSDAAEMVKNATEESRRNYETALLLERERAKQEKEERVKLGRKEIYVEEKEAASRMRDAIDLLLSRVEDYFRAEAR